MAQLHVTPGATLKFGHVARHQRIRVKAPLLHQLSGEQAGKALRDGEQQVGRLRLHAVHVALEDNAALVKHDNGIGVGLTKPVVHRQRAALVVHKREPFERQRRSGQRGHRAPAATDVACGHQFARVLQRPTHLGVPAPVGVAHHLVRRWRKALHEAEPLQRDCVRIGELLRVDSESGGCQTRDKHSGKQRVADHRVAFLRGIEAVVMACWRKAATNASAGRDRRCSARRTRPTSLCSDVGSFKGSCTSRPTRNDWA